MAEMFHGGFNALPVASAMASALPCSCHFTPLPMELRMLRLLYNEVHHLMSFTVPRERGTRHWSVNDVSPLFHPGSMQHLLFWIIGFGTLWAGIKLFDDEAVFIVTAIVGSGFVLAGLISAPPGLQIVIDSALIIVLFSVCMECIKRGGKQGDR